MITPLDYFASLVQQDDSIPLFEAALTLAQDTDPQFDIGGAQVEVDRMAAKLRNRIPPDTAHVPKLRLLNQYFYAELGFGGNINNYYDPDNSYLHRVARTRRGIPISLAMIYMEIAQQIGLDVRGISFPGHFLMKLSTQAGEIIIDPVNGSSLSREELEERLEPFAGQIRQAGKPLATYLEPASARDILIRMLRNLKSLFFEYDRWQSLLNVQQRLLILLPGDVAERRDRGLAYAQLDCPSPALDDIEAYLAARPDAADANVLSGRLPSLRAAIRRLN
ncbi:tetratricopeptide repeat protein [Actimicrobium sp. CCC2.4]|uniref:SirB1 family protein n=1 Tax=Actimicrobium sp. CCC2.4 TaxID=3048606 RepID=UPI002AC9EB6D|nr:tetratricopeptide repeat protein [Actimicrobium sp. CCC2.4]MEB0134986.1 tetratricopeptide repeat protein [Actimicrobium sp. CCC2.4]WPX31966.1 tetratricopeptide repeat protein [Actimicrobium sp. CCC2.4]